MRYMLDTCICTFLMCDSDRISPDVRALFEDYDNCFCISAETVRELIVAFNNKGLVSHYWKTAEEMVNSLSDEYYIQILPLREEHMRTYARLQLNKAMDHKDPSDHVIISHAITERIPLISSDRKFDFYRNQGLDFIKNE